MTNDLRLLPDIYGLVVNWLLLGLASYSMREVPPAIVGVVDLACWIIAGLCLQSDIFLISIDFYPFEAYAAIAVVSFSPRA